MSAPTVRRAKTTVASTSGSFAPRTNVETDGGLDTEVQPEPSVYDWGDVQFSQEGNLFEEMGYWKHRFPGIVDKKFVLHPEFDITTINTPHEPWMYVDSMDWDEDEEDEADALVEEYAALQDALRDDPQSVPPIVVAKMPDGQLEIIDGYHRSGLALDAGVTAFPTFVVDLTGETEYDHNGPVKPRAITVKMIAAGKAGLRDDEGRARSA